MTTIDTTFDSRRAAKILNAHHRRTMAGFYNSIIGGRFFEARVHQGKLQVSDWDDWFTLEPHDAIFHDHNGNNIPLS